MRIVLGVLMAAGFVVPAADVLGKDVPAIDVASPLRTRVGAPEPSVVAAYAGTGASDIHVHVLTDAEWARFDTALARLPALHRRILQRHLKRLSFLDLKPGAGSALTARIGEGTGEDAAFSITLRASLLDESLASFLGSKEANLFVDDGTGQRLQVEAGALDALTYVLLHEATHVVDQVLGLTADSHAPLMAGVWESAREPVAAQASSLALQTGFRRAPRIPLDKAPAYYQALAASPFVSFYATAAAPEDIAELFAWQQLSACSAQAVSVQIRDAAGQVVFTYAPLENRVATARFAQVQQVLGVQGCAGRWA